MAVDADSLPSMEDTTVGSLTLVLWVFVAVAIVPGLYALHRLGLWLEDRGYIYYWHKKPKGGGGAVGSFVAFQRMIEPQAEHVIQVSRVNHLAGDEGASGQDRPPIPPEDRPVASVDPDLS
jgi:hypothetical protein